MDKHELSELLDQVAAGSVSAADALERIQVAPVADVGYARLDLARGVRQGVGEVVYGEGKTAEQIAGIIDALVGAGQGRVLVTRLSPEKAERVRTLVTSGVTLDYRAD